MNTHSSSKFSLLRSPLKCALTCLLGLAISQSTLAQGENSNKGKWIVGLKAAQVEVSGLNTDTAEFEEADAFGIVVGYEFNNLIGGTNGTASFEVEYLATEDTCILRISLFWPSILQSQRRHLLR